MLHLVYAFGTCSSGRGLAIECSQQIGVFGERRMERPAAKDTGGTGFMTASQTLQLHPKDNVLVALNDLRKGEEIDFSGRTYTLRADVPAKHKFAMHDISAGDDVVMYGVLIGKAIEPIGLGERLTTRNTHHQAAPFQEKTENFFGIRQDGWSSRHAELLARRPPCFLRKPQHIGTQTSI